MAETLIRIAAVKASTGKSKASLYRDIAAGKFPAPYSIGANSVAWREAEVQDWIAKQIAAGNTRTKSACQPASTAA